MRHSLFFYLFLIAGFIGISSATVNAQNVFKVTKPSSIGYLEYLPKGYDNNSNKYPLVIFLHGLGERGPKSSDFNTLKNGISTVERNGPPRYVKYGTDFPFILISPQLKSNYGDWPIWYVKEVLDYCIDYLRVDERRIYLTGLSLGGGGVWTTAQEYPELFAAIAPVCGSRNSPSKANRLANENLPVWGFHGNKDGTVPMLRTVNMINAINACKPAPKPTAKITIYQGIGHNCWGYAYQPDHAVQNPNVYDWMLSFTNTTNASNKIPVANAGNDKTVQGSSVTLTGSGKDPDGSITGYNWKKISGPSATLSNANSSKVKISNLSKGTYIFRLQVKDNKGNTDSDYIKVAVQSGSAETPLAVSAGGDKSVTLPTNSMAIAGHADGEIASYKWSKLSGHSVGMSGAGTPTLKVSGLVAGSYVFRLIVKDKAGKSKFDDMKLTVKHNSSTNTAPSVSAGPNRIVGLPISHITLFGSASDRDGKITSYQWTKVSGGSCTFSSTKVSRPKITRFGVGTYVFRLTVTDNKGATKSDDVIIKFDNPPIVNAGGDKTIKLPVNSFTIKGTATDKDGKIKKYVWSKYSGPGVMLTHKDTSKVTLSRLSKGTYILRFAVWDDTGLQSSDLVKVVVR